jgi:RNA polymerase sigma-70 factor, ECF subfamily
MHSCVVDARARVIEDVYRTRYVAFRNALATVSGDRETARDAVQEGFAEAYAYRRKLRDDSALEAWIWKIALRAALRIRARVEGVELHDALDPRLPEPVLDTELADALRALPPQRRLIFFLRHFADLSCAQIAEACEVSEGTVAASLSDARAQLREALEQPSRTGARDG